MEDALVLTDVHKRFGSFTAVDRLSLTVPRGQVVGFLGPNGAGKTTTLRLVMSILYPDAGEIAVLGRRAALEVKDRIGYLPEERGLYRKMTVEQTLRYFGRLKGLRGAALAERVARQLARVGLSDWRGKRVEALSKGMQQKVQFITTILHDPDLVILDEPFSGLDPLNTQVLQTLLFDLKHSGASVLFSTHDMESAERLCDRIVLINRGRKLIEGRLSDVRARFSAQRATLEGSGEFAALRGAPGVRSLHITEGQARLELSDGADAGAILRRALEHAQVTRFEIHRPSLREIFVELVAADQPSSDAARSVDPLAAHASAQRSVQEVA
jgi:ABC-2 type transport system ATP-binding protein